VYKLNTVPPLKNTRKPPEEKQGKRGRKAKRTSSDLRGLVKEVDTEVTALLMRHPELKKRPVEQAVANCLRHDATTQPRSWWWTDSKPLDLDSAVMLYYRARKCAVGSCEMLPPLSELGATYRAEPPQITKQMIEMVLSQRRWLREQKPHMPPAKFIACKRDLQREERQSVAFLKGVAEKMRTRLVADGSKHPPEKVARARDALASLEAQIKDFESKVRVSKFANTQAEF
jgi:hypothetical protein